MQKLVSIIIPTYKRKESVLALLDSLFPEMKDDYEIIIIEQGENNGALYKKYGKKTCDVNYYFIEQRGTSIAKNFGVKKSSGKYLVFFDDDVVVEKGVVTAHIANYVNSPIGAVCGRVITPGQANEEGRTDVGRISFFGNFSDAFSSKIRQEISTVIGCNCSWRRDVFELIGGFDEQFTGAIREDSDISLRTSKAGFSLMFDPKALVHHMRAETGGGRKSEGRLAWYFNFLSNETYFFLKHRPVWVVPLILVTRWEWMFRCMFGFGREVSIRSLSTPFLGIMDGIQKYRRYTNEHRS